MKTIKWIILSMSLFATTNSDSQLSLLVGYDCFHNGEYYASVPTSMSCPDPGSGLTARNIGDQYMDVHDPNDHDCVITRIRRNQLD